VIVHLEVKTLTVIFFSCIFSYVCCLRKSELGAGGRSG